MKTINYLSEKINELPINCLYNKGKVGCGGTTLAIEGNKPYIIAVPFTSLIENKLAQYPNERRSEPILAEYGERRTSKTYLENYVKNTKVPVIMTTYDSLGVLTEKLGDLVKDFNLLVDEYHILFNHYSFRAEAAQSVLTNYKKYKSFTFMTATPLDEEFLLEELKGIPVVNEEWDKDSLIAVQVISKPVNSVEKFVMAKATEFISGKIEGNAYFFVNSVKFVNKIIRKLNLTKENCRVIYSKNNPAQLTVPRGNTYDKPKKINFLTSTAFEGCDIYDANGKTYIVSDANNEHTLLDISTSVMQIAGRIRNSKYIGKMMHIYTTTRYNVELSYDEFKEACEAQVDNDKEIISAINNTSDKARAKAIKGFMIDNFYFRNDNNKLVFDANKIKVDLFNYKVVNGTYKTIVNVVKAYREAGAEVSSQVKTFVEMDSPKLKNFKELVKDLEKVECVDITMTPEYKTLIAFYPYMKEAIRLLGLKEIKRLEYVQKRIKDAMILAKKGDNVDAIIISKIANKIRVGVSYTNTEIKQILQEAYNLAGLDKTAKGKDIEQWYSIKRIEHNTRILIETKKFITIKND